MSVRIKSCPGCSGCFSLSKAFNKLLPPQAEAASRYCLGIAARPYQRFNTYCFKLHQSLPPLSSHPPSSPSSLGSFFSVSFYYFASSSFSPLTSLHIILALVAFSSSSCSPCKPSYPLCPYLLQFYPSSVFSHLSNLLSCLFFGFSHCIIFLLCLFLGILFNLVLVFPLFLPVFEELG